jgi:hypothetical protein
MTGKSWWFRRLQFQRLQFRRLERLPAPLHDILIFTLVLILFTTLMVAMGCSRPSGLPADEGANQADQGKLPFRDNDTKGPGPNSAEASSSEASAVQSPKRDPGEASGPPFQPLSSVPELPLGTLVTVRLEKQISSDRIGDAGTFAAIVDEPVLMDGKTAVPRGATVTGRIESAPASDVGRGRGYIRLTLDTIAIAGKRLPLRTSSLFVRGKAGEVLSSGHDAAEGSHPTVTRLRKGRRLTFRLSATLPLDQQARESGSQNDRTSSQ